MTLQNLCKILDLPDEVVKEIEKYKKQHNSNIMMFQSLFDVESVDYESMAVLDWVFPGEKGELSDLSENTSLRRNMKRFLLDGNKVGWAKGILKND